MYFHSVTLDKEKCRGCTNCIKRCPTEAIRVQNGKAKIIKERCIDCGQCIRYCPHHAKMAVTDELDILNNYKYKVALPPPSLYGQFKNKPEVDRILTALKTVGFDEIYEVALAAEAVTKATKELLATTRMKYPIISSACPAVVRLIMVRFPDLIQNLLPIISPMELAAVKARERAVNNTGLKPEEIGVFFITPCAAKVTCARLPIGISDPVVDGCISVGDVYRKMVGVLDKLEEVEKLSVATFEGVEWARNGGESYALSTDRRIAVDGIENVIDVLEKVDAGQLSDIIFIEASACVGGCIGGPLAVENAFVAKTRIQNIRSTPYVKTPSDVSVDELKFKRPIEANSIMNLSSDVASAIAMMGELKNIENGLPGLDCGSCGSPSCRALAEDIVRGFADEMDCIIKFREKFENEG